MKNFSVDMLIVTALPEELAALDVLFDFRNQPVLIGKSTYCYVNENIVCETTGESFSAAVLCLNAMGNTNAGIDVANALQNLNAAYVFMFGIAGGVKSEVDLADVIVPDKVFYNAHGKQYSSHRDSRPEVLKIDPILLQRLHTYNFHSESEKDYKVRVGPLAVGEQVIASSNSVSELQKLHAKMVGIEMESYGVGLAVLKSGQASSFVAIRGISDHADEIKNDGYRSKALKNAADFFVGFIKSGLLPKKRANSNQLPKFIAIHHLSLYRRPSINQAVQNYLKRLQSFDVIELPIDQVDLFIEGSLVDPLQALHRQKEILTRLETILQEHPNCELGYLGLAHIPLMFHMGYEINRREVCVFGNDYNGGEWIDLPEKSVEPSFHVEGIPEQVSQQNGDVVMLMSISYAINSPEPYEVVDQPLAHVHIRAEIPQLGLIDSKQVLNVFTEIFRDTLQKINHRFPYAQRLHLFYAGPPTLAFRCGQQINRNIDPEILVYNYSRREFPNYRWALNLQTGEIIE